MNGLSLVSEASITSREIADLVGSRHDNVRVAIERLVGRGLIALPAVQEISTGGRPGLEFIFSGERGKRDSIIVVAQLSPEFTARLVDRWQQLEEMAQSGGFAIPQTLPDALRLAADLADANRALEGKVAEQAPKVEFHDRVVVAPDAISIAEAAKTLGTGRNRLMAILRRMQWLNRRNEPYQEKINNGWMDVKISKLWDHPDQGLKRSLTPLITGKGLAKLQALGVGQPPKAIAA